MIVFICFSAIILVSLLLGAFVFAKKHNIKPTTSHLQTKISYLCFVFRWFLIGRYHCNLSPKHKKLIRILNRVFWGIVIISICVCLGRVIEWIC